MDSKESPCWDGSQARRGLEPWGRPYWFARVCGVLYRLYRIQECAAGVQPARANPGSGGGCQTAPQVGLPLPVFVLSGYDAFLGFLLISAAVPVLALVTNKLVAPKSRTGERDLTYESGMEPIGGAWIQFNIRYYMFALVFVIFDVETVFLYPWAVAFHRLGLLAFIEALVFISILVVALAYAWRKGALEWS